MKRTSCIELTLLLTLTLIATSTTGVFAATRTDSSALTLTYTFTEPRLSTITIENQAYDQVFLPDSAISGRPGDPSLPVKGAYILLPSGTTVASVSVHGTSHSLGNGYHLVPVGQALPMTSNPVPPTPNPTVYASDDVFPATQYTTVGVYQQRGFSILVLALSPIQYRPASGELLASSSLEVTVTLTPAHAQTSLFRGLPQDYALVRGRVDNAQELSTYPASAARSSADLMILTTSALRSGFIPLAEAHNATGVRTIIRTLTDVGGTDTESIRNYIRTMYNTTGISYVLLGGDDGVVNARQLWVEGMDENVTHYEDYLPSDIYYACLDGPYNYDGDDKWGEPNDGTGGGDVDLMAEVWVGRACVDNLADVHAFVTKSLSYMNSTNDSYLKNVTLAGEYLGDYGIASYGSSYLNQLINGSSDDGYTTVGIPASSYTIDTLYDEDYLPYGWNPSDIITRINNGAHIINHLGHASPDYNMKLYESDVDQLTNTKYCFIYSQGCDSGAFDVSGYDCIAEVFTAKATHGAFAGVWNARYGFFWSYSTDGDSQRLNRQLWDAVFSEGKTTVGAANHDSKEDNLFIIGRSCIRWVIYETNLFGDPSLDLVNAVTPPPPPEPQLSIVAASGGNRVLHLSVENIGYATASNVVWTTKINGGIFHLISISLNGSPFTIPPGNTTNLTTTLQLFGLGKVEIQVTTEYANPWNGTGFVFGSYLLKVAKT